MIWLKKNGKQIASITIMGTQSMQRVMNQIPSEKRFKTISIKGWYCKNGDFHFFLPQYAISSCRVGAIACQSLF